MLSCKEIVARGDAIIAGELGIHQKIRVYLHLAICSFCRLYLRELRLLIRSFRHLYKPVSRDRVNEVISAIRRESERDG